jgi:hypothetical protein
MSQFKRQQLMIGYIVRCIEPAGFHRLVFDIQPGKRKTGIAF